MKQNLPRVPEKVEQAHIVKLLRTLGATVYVLGTKRRKGDYQGTMQTPGLPDLLAFLPVDKYQILVFIEVKAKDGRMRPAQRDFAQRMARCGVGSRPMVVGGYDDVVAWLIDQGHATAGQFPHYRTEAPNGHTAGQ